VREGRETQERKKENYTSTTTEIKGEELKNCMHGACKKMRERRSRK
jgi:hypothetical protein